MNRPGLTLLSEHDIILMAKHKRTLEAIFTDPVRANIRWEDIEGMFRNHGADLAYPGGSVVIVRIQGRKIVFHSPHPRKETPRGAIRRIRDFLIELGITP